MSEPQGKGRMEAERRDGSREPESRPRRVMLLRPKPTAGRRSAAAAPSPVRSTPGDQTAVSATPPTVASSATGEARNLPRERFVQVYIGAVALLVVTLFLGDSWIANYRTGEYRFEPHGAFFFQNWNAARDQQRYNFLLARLRDMREEIGIAANPPKQLSQEELQRLWEDFEKGLGLASDVPQSEIDRLVERSGRGHLTFGNVVEAYGEQYRRYQDELAQLEAQRVPVSYQRGWWRPMRALLWLIALGGPFVLWPGTLKRLCEQVVSGSPPSAE